MFIELTDHLACPAGHEDGFLVLLPSAMRGRRVMEGLLGCPVCGRETPIHGGEVAFDDAEPAPAETALRAEALEALGGIEGPGGYLALVGAPGALAEPVATRFPGVRLVLVNPPAGVVGSESASVLRGRTMPLKARSMRLVVCGKVASDPATWLDASLAAVLPGNRIVVEGPTVRRPDLEILAEADGVWVGRRRQGPR